jgi:hypothetical protein
MNHPPRYLGLSTFRRLILLPSSLAVLLALAAGSAWADTLLSGSMEGSLAFPPGSYLNGGYHFKPTQKATSPYQVTFSNVHVDLPVACTSGGPVVGTVVLPLPNATYTVPANSTAWIPTGDQNSPLAWQGAVGAPPLCGPGGTMYNAAQQGGASFSADITSSESGKNVQLQFHYRVPAAKGRPNTDCTNTADPNRDRADVCGASWSATTTVTPGSGGIE